MKDGAPGGTRTPDLLVRSFGVQKSYLVFFFGVVYEQKALFEPSSIVRRSSARPACRCLFLSLGLLLIVENASETMLFQKVVHPADDVGV